MCVCFECTLLEYPIKQPFGYSVVSFRSHEVEEICLKCFCFGGFLKKVINSFNKVHDFFMTVSTSHVKVREFF